MKTVLDNKGVTLVEGIVAGVLLSIGAVMLTSGFLAANNMLISGNKTNEAKERTITAANEGFSGDTEVVEDIIPKINFSADGLVLTVENGKLVTYTDTENEGIRFYRYFPK